MRFPRTRAFSSAKLLSAAAFILWRANFQQAFFAQLFCLFAYRSARAVQLRSNLCGRARRPQPDEREDFLVGPGAHIVPRQWRRPLLCRTILASLRRHWRQANVTIPASFGVGHSAMPIKELPRDCRGRSCARLLVHPRQTVILGREPRRPRRLRFRLALSRTIAGRRRSERCSSNSQIILERFTSVPFEKMLCNY